MGNVLVVWVEEDLVNIEGHLPVLGPVHAVLAHHHPHQVPVLAAPATQIYAPITCMERYSVIILIVVSCCQEKCTNLPEPLLKLQDPLLNLPDPLFKLPDPLLKYYNNVLCNVLKKPTTTNIEFFLSLTDTVVYLCKIEDFCETLKFVPLC